MALDFVSEVDKKFFADNLLVNEDWDTGLGRLDELNGLLDIESNLTTDELMQQLPDDLEFGRFNAYESQLGRYGVYESQIPMLEDHGLTTEDIGIADPWKEFGSDGTGSDSGIESTPIKEEPMSPALSHVSDSSNDSSSLPGGLEFGTWQNIVTSPTKGEIKKESPPTTPLFALEPNYVNCLPTATPLPSLPGSNGVQITIPVHGAKLVGNSLTSVVDNKIKIQPKPSPPIQPKTALPNQTVNKPLVLTAEEFANLTAQGLLKFHPPAQEVGKAPVTSCVTSRVSTAPTPSPAPSQIAATPLPIRQQRSGVDVRAIKRQQRMIKNRESACLSRRKKKKVPTATLR